MRKITDRSVPGINCRGHQDYASSFFSNEEYEKEIGCTLRLDACQALSWWIALGEAPDRKSPSQGIAKWLCRNRERPCPSTLPPRSQLLPTVGLRGRRGMGKSISKNLRLLKGPEGQCSRLCDEPADPSPGDSLLLTLTVGSNTISSFYKLGGVRMPKGNPSRDQFNRLPMEDAARRVGSRKPTFWQSCMGPQAALWTQKTCFEGRKHTRGAAAGKQMQPLLAPLYKTIFQSGSEPVSCFP